MTIFKFTEARIRELPLVVMTNEVPKFADRSGALVGRFIVLPMRQSFYGREDPTFPLAWTPSAISASKPIMFKAIRATISSSI